MVSGDGLTVHQCSGHRMTAAPTPTAPTACAGTTGRGRDAALAPCGSVGRVASGRWAYARGAHGCHHVATPGVPIRAMIIGRVRPHACMLCNGPWRCIVITYAPVVVDRRRSLLHVRWGALCSLWHHAFRHFRLMTHRSAMARAIIASSHHEASELGVICINHIFLIMVAGISNLSAAI